ncbi:hypothetical protein V6N12_019782 [Hibiscus sabdariffa]|uniref:RNA polymerase Rpb4/RPC9 core domain-containing protein n=2 Tax=Hibiscus sabdariffa TaxID=183260 RepID=A0ABR2B0A4_9ROSI
MSNLAAKSRAPDAEGYGGKSNDMILSNPETKSNEDIINKTPAKSFNDADRRISKNLVIRDMVPPSSNPQQETLAPPTESNKKSVTILGTLEQGENSNLPDISNIDAILCDSMQAVQVYGKRPGWFLPSTRPLSSKSNSQTPRCSGMSGEEEENAAELKIGEEFLKAKCLMNCEVALILEHKYEQLQQMSDDPMNQVSQVFEKSLQYVKRFSRYKNPDAVRQVREILSRYRLAEFELCVLGNLCPETVEEAIAMVPSIKTKGRAHDDDAIERMLNDLSLIKKFE